MAMSSVDWRASLVRQVTCGSRTRGSRQLRTFAAIIARVTSHLPKISIELWRSDAVVLFDWLMSVDLDAVPVSHPAENQALADLLTRLAHETDVPGVTQKQIDAARAEVARDMDW